MKIIKFTHHYVCINIISSTILGVDNHTFIIIIPFRSTMIPTKVLTFRNTQRGTNSSSLIFQFIWNSPTYYVTTWNIVLCFYLDLLCWVTSPAFIWSNNYSLEYAQLMFETVQFLLDRSLVWFFSKNVAE